MNSKIPILLSFYACTNGTTTLVFGQLTYTAIRDLSFKDYTQRKTFKTLFRLYQSRPYANQDLILVFDTGRIKLSTNKNGGFYDNTITQIPSGTLQHVLLPDGTEVKTIDGLYEKKVHHFKSNLIVVSDLDDTLLHSFIYRKLRKVRTLMFTTVEKRKAVANMQELIHFFSAGGGEPVYLSNSEQNLYPIIYRFLQHNQFPNGPIFLKQLRSLWDVLWNIKFPLRHVHKVMTLEHLINLFPERKFILMGDNTQQDLTIYIDIAYKYPQNIKYIFIRKVIDKLQDQKLIESSITELMNRGIQLYYSETFPEFERTSKDAIQSIS
jgi:phosphatidate phosphatase APP1